MKSWSFSLCNVINYSLIQQFSSKYLSVLKYSIFNLVWFICSSIQSYMWHWTHQLQITIYNTTCNIWTSFNRTQSRVVIGLLTGHNTLRRYLHLLGLLDSPLCRRCGVKEETSGHILCECEALVSLRHVYLGSFLLEPEDIKSISLGAIWNFSKASGVLWFDMGHKGSV
jgi:hypothetical protein